MHGEELQQQPEEPAPQPERGPAAEPPRIYVADLAAYNNGQLHGRWIDAARDVEELQADIDELLAASPVPNAEEWAIHDFSGFGPLRLDEHETLDYISRLAKGIEEHGLAFAGWASVMEDPESFPPFEDAYRGHWGRLDDYVQNLVDDLGYEEQLDRAVPDALRPYVRIDIAALGRDMELGGDLYVLPAEDGGVWIFDGHV